MANRNKSNQKIPRSERGNKDAVEELKGTIRKLRSDKRKLISEVEGLKKALEENVQFLKGETDSLSLQELIKAAKSNKSLKDIKSTESTEVLEVCNKCMSQDVFISKISAVGTIKLCRSCRHREVTKNG